MIPDPLRWASMTTVPLAGDPRPPAPARPDRNDPADGGGQVDRRSSSVGRLAVTVSMRFDTCQPRGDTSKLIVPSCDVCPA